MEKIKNIIMISTSLITIIGIFIKATSNIMEEIMKMKFENAPGGQSIFQIVFKIATFLVLLFEGLILSFIIILVIVNLWNNTISFGTPLITYKDTSIQLWVVVIGFMVSGFGTIHIFFEAEKVYFYKMNGKVRSKLSKRKMVFNLVNMAISAIFILAILCTLYATINSKIDIVMTERLFVFESKLDLADIENIIMSLLVMIFQSLIFMLGFNVFEHNSILTKNYDIIFETKSNDIECKCYIEFKDYFLVRINKEDIFISKTDVSRIKKKLVEEKRSRSRKNKKISSKLEIEELAN